MLRNAIIDALRSGMQVTAAVDPKWLRDPALDPWRGKALHLVESAPSRCVSTVWQEGYATCDYTLVIAPESDGVLQETLRLFDSWDYPTMNVQGRLLQAASDKLQTASCLARAGIPHPPTILLSDLSSEWMEREPSRSREWIIKSRDGVGCDGLRKVSKIELLEIQSVCDKPDSLIVQPFRPGIAASAAAMMSSSGSIHWLPKTIQDLRWHPTPHYAGGAVKLNLLQELLFQNRRATAGCKNLPELARQLDSDLQQLLDRVLPALEDKSSSDEDAGRHGMDRNTAYWIGIDFLVHVEKLEDPFCIIEVNPRLTTSFVGLSECCGGGLIADLFRLAKGQSLPARTTLRPVSFSSDGTLRR